MSDLPLEPTAEQIDKIATAISVASSDAYALENPRDVELEGAARAMWRLIAPLVLEAAAQACEAELATGFCADPEARDWIEMCIERIRAMKGGAR